MKPFCEIDLRNAIQEQWKKVHKKVDSMSNEEIMANDSEILAENIYQEFHIPPVEIFNEDESKRSIKAEKIKKYIDPFMRDYGDKEYKYFDGIVATFYYPYSGERDLFKCKASTFSVSGYPEIDLENEYISFRVEKTLNEMDGDNAKEKLLGSVSHDLNAIKTGIGYANSDAEEFNLSLKSQTLGFIQDKKKKVESFYSIAQALEITIEKKDFIARHIPIKRNILPIEHKYKSEPYYCISDEEYNDILSMIKHTASTYERTPSSYKSMKEEDLRNTLLAALNGTYQGDANGEVFRNSGKTDISIESENRAAFIAECKMWTGQKEVERAIHQLDSYTTWRDCKTALVYFVRRKDFLKTLDNMRGALNNIGCVKKVKEMDKNEFDVLVFSEKNVGQKIKMRVMLFNLYSGEG